MNYFSVKKEQIKEEFSSSFEKGLTSQQVNNFIDKFGENKLSEKKKKSLAVRFFEQFKDVMIIILIIAAIISFVIACYEGNAKDFFEPALILLIVILNAIMGVAQESKAEKALDALQGLSAPHARVIRDGSERVIESSQLVPGDIIKLEAGDFVPADSRLIESVSLKSEESALTGESVPSEKDAKAEVADDAALGDRANMVFSGCSITYGTARAIVTATGMNTEMGKIAGLLENEKNSMTPLQQKLADLGKYLGIVALVACAIIFVIGLLNGINPLEIFMTAVSLAVSAIPEGLPAIVTIVLSIGVQRMVKQNAIIRRLPAVETLGSASVICSDKTGTLTQNRMTLVSVYTEKTKNIEEIGNNISKSAKELLELATLCCDGSISVEGEKVTHIGDPTETSIIYAAYKLGMKQEDLNKNYKRICELPFDSDRKLMTSVNEMNGKIVVITKGAFDNMEKICTRGNLSVAKNQVERMSSQALRVLSIGIKIIEKLPDEITNDALESNLTFMGLVGMIDPPRPEAKDAVDICKKAGIKPVMITGDHIVTACAIAKDLGILGKHDFAITGSELDNMTDDEFDKKVDHISVYARVSPENKIRIVKAWQKQDRIVSMTGDGVNDAPALKAADIGCAMGITGTDVAKGASDMTLTDDNFATIVDAIKEGRGIYSNIKKVVGFLLGTNIGEIITVFLAMVLWHKTPLLSMQLLWINLVTDSLPAIALGMEPVEEGIMDRKPRPKNESIFANGLGLRVVLQGIMFGALTLIGFVIGEKVTGNITGGQTMAFIILSLSQLVQSFNMRSNRSLFKIGPFTNKKLNISCLISLLLVLAVLFTPLKTAFALALLPVQLYLIALGLALVPLVVMEFSKAFGLIKHKND